MTRNWLTIAVASTVLLWPGSQGVGAAAAEKRRNVKITERHPNKKPKRIYYGYRDHQGKFVQNGPDAHYTRSGMLFKGQFYRDGIRHGACKSWYAKDQLREEGAYANDLKDGVWKKWYRNGNEEAIGEFSGGEKDGKFTQWHENGLKRSEVVFRDDAKDGREQGWLADGTKVADISFENGRKHGPEYLWYNSGAKKSVTHYQAGEKDGKEETWLEDGQPSVSRSYRQGKKDGAETVWGPKGKKQSQTTYQLGQRDGVEMLWHDNGAKKSSIAYANGKKHGLEQHWYENGKPRSSGQRENGKRHGPFQEFHPNGRPQLACNYDHGVLAGEYKTWDKTGAALSNGVYRNDEPSDGTFVELAFGPDQYFVNTYRGGKAVEGVLYEHNKPKTGAIEESHMGGGRWRHFSFENGRRHGVEKRWYKSGAPQLECTWNQNQLAKVLTQWHENGKPMWRIELRDGVPHGRETHWKLDGKILADGFNRDGKPWDGLIVVDSALRFNYIASAVVKVFDLRQDQTPEQALAAKEYKAVAAKKYEDIGIPLLKRFKNGQAIE